MKLIRVVLGSVLAALVATASAQSGPVLIYGIMELSGTGATPGTNFDNGVKLAVKEINASGGILGRQINYVSTDTQTARCRFITSIACFHAKLGFSRINCPARIPALRETPAEQCTSTRVRGQCKSIKA